MYYTDAASPGGSLHHHIRSLGAARQNPMTMDKRRSRIVEAIIFATILIDFVGFSILIPVLPLYADALGASQFEVGLMVALYTGGMVIFLPIWGWVSDRIGRRPVLLLCLLGTAASFALLAVASSVGEIYVARALGGFFGASVGTAQAYMTDITDADDRARGMGLIGAAFGIGFVLGNLLGGYLEELAFWATAALAISNFGLAYLFLPESRQPDRGSRDWRGLGRAVIPTPILVWRGAESARTRIYMFLFFQVFLSFSTLEAMFALYANRRFDWHEWDIALYLSYVGLVIGITQGLLIGRLTRVFGEVLPVIAGLAIMGGGMLALPFAPEGPWLIAIGGLLAFGNGIALPAFTSLFSKVCGSEYAGEALGQSQVMAQTGRTLGALAGGWVMQSLGLGAPFLLGAIGTALALLVFLASLRLLVPPGVSRIGETANWPGTLPAGYGPGGGTKEEDE